jgi:hypothetical protein
MKGVDMRKQLSVNTSVCSEYQRLLEESQRALEIWNEHRAEFCQFHFIEREAGDELLRLQAKYARAYTMLQNHERNCPLCQFVSRIEERDSENSSDTLSDYELCT